MAEVFLKPEHLKFFDLPYSGVSFAPFHFRMEGGLLLADWGTFCLQGADVNKAGVLLRKS